MGNGEEVGKISYSVTIDVSALKAGTKTAEEAIKTSFGSAGKETEKFAKTADTSFASVTKSLAVLTASFLSLRTVSNVLGDSVEAANNFSRAMNGVSSVAAGAGYSAEEARAAVQAFSADGMIPAAQSANAFKNALSSGFTLEQTIQLLNGLKEQAINNRQAYYDLGGAVVATTEGIKNGNSVLADATGTTKNLSVIAKEAGISVDQMGSVSTNSAYRMAILNGFMQEAGKSAGDMSTYMETAAYSDDRLRAATVDLQTKIGNLANILRADATKGLAEFINENGNAIIKVGAFAGGAIAAGVAMYGLSKAFAVTNMVVGAFRGLMIANAAAQAAFAAGNTTAAASLLAVRAAAIRTIASLTIIGTIMAAVGFAAGEVIGNMAEEADKAEVSTDNLNNTIKDTSGYQSASKGAQDLTKKLKELDDQVKKVNRDYKEQLAKIVQDHKQTVKELTKQIKDENDNYNAAVKKRLTAFQEEQGKEESEHLKKVKNIQNQIDFLQKHQHSSNQQQLSDLKFSLAQENAQYEKRNEERKAKYDADAETEKISYEKRLTENQKKLEKELEFLNKHKDSVKKVRGVILLDEIESLKRSREEQLKSLRMQKQDIISEFKKAYGQAGAASAGAFKKNLKDNWGKPFKVDVVDEKGKKVKGTAAIYYGAKFADGGFTGQGNKYEEAGIVHRGEYVLPKHMVNQSTGLPNAEAIDTFGSGRVSADNSNTYNITIPISGAIVTSPQDQRKFAEVIGKKINEVMQQKGFKPALEGM